MRRWLLIRHGASIWNKEQRIQGQIDVPLSDLGREQVRALARRLSGEDICACFTSPLMRAKETAHLLIQGMNRSIPLIVLEELKERQFGEWEGRLIDEVATQDPVWNDWVKSDQMSCPPGGETIEDFSARTWGAIETIREQVPWGSLMVAGHGGSLKAIICHLIGLPMSSISRMSLGNGSLTIVEEREGSGWLIVYNDTCSFINGTAKK
ncbi:MAG: histidine phosphatase family protein [Armatimonadetes bacterium]|nr:histidine phosphatase family protein [Armatimonadota bacterium]MDW8121485.1 histidine phosphatase family protein [Armatimonadota bacterium]